MRVIRTLSSDLRQSPTKRSKVYFWIGSAFLATAIIIFSLPSTEKAITTMHIVSIAILTSISGLFFFLYDKHKGYKIRE